MAINRVSDSELSPIYQKLYNKVAALPAFEELKDRVYNHVRQAQVVSYTYSKTQWGNGIECNARVSVGHKVCDIGFNVEGTENVPYFNLEVDHLVSSTEVDCIYFDNVARYGKPIRPHGLVKEDTVRQGAAPRGKNQFSPWALSKIFHTDEFESLLKRAKQRIHQELIAKLTSDDAFVQFSENLQLEDILGKLSPYSHLPPDVLHRAVDLMYVKATMEK
jgi:hypothetical protein